MGPAFHSTGRGSHTGRDKVRFTWRTSPGCCMRKAWAARAQMGRAAGRPRGPMRRDRVLERVGDGGSDERWSDSGHSLKTQPVSVPGSPEGHRKG